MIWQCPVSIWSAVVVDVDIDANQGSLDDCCGYLQSSWTRYLGTGRLRNVNVKDRGRELNGQLVRGI